MKKNKFNLKLTLSGVCLILSFLLIVIGNKNNYCLFFGFILMAVASALYALNRDERINKTLIEIDNEIEDIDPNDIFTLNELYKERKKIKKLKTKKNFVFYLFSFLLVIISFSFMF